MVSVVALRAHAQFIAFFHDLCFSFVNLITLAAAWLVLLWLTAMFLVSAEKFMWVIGDIQITEKRSTHPIKVAFLFRSVITKTLKTIQFT